MSRRLVVLLMLLAGAVRLSAGDTTPSLSLPRSTPESQGVSSAGLLAFVEAAEKEIDALHSLILVRHGRVVAEGWWAPYAPGEPHMMFSLSKSFTSTAVGLAVAEGRLSVDDSVLGFFPEDAPAQPGEHLRAMRVRDLLTMSTGQHNEDIASFPYGADENLVKRFLAIPVAHKPGTHFVYNTPASYMLSAIVQKVTGQTVLDYLKPRLFDPLGISGQTWEASKAGVSMGGFGLSIRTEDIAKFGLLYLQKGQWQGRQIVPAPWVEAATSRQVSNGSNPSSDWEQGYGYQFWRTRHGFYRGDGAHGQFCIVMPQYDAVLAITAGTRDLPGVMNLAWQKLVPALAPSALPADKGAHDTLTAKLGSLALPAQDGAASSPLAASIVGRTFTVAPNAKSIETLTLESLDPKGDAVFAITMAGSAQRIPAAPRAWRKGEATVRGVPMPFAASGAWTSPSTYTLKVVQYRTPFVSTLRLTFDGNQVTAENEDNVGAGDRRITQLVGRAAAK
jgi:CubicO group peptidase (beta-lactamase class C family)